MKLFQLGDLFYIFFPYSYLLNLKINKNSMKIWEKHFVIWGQNFWRGQILGQPKFKTTLKLGAMPNLRPKVRPGQFWSQARPMGPGQELEYAYWESEIDNIVQETESINRHDLSINSTAKLNRSHSVFLTIYNQAAKRLRKILSKQWDIVN